MAGPFWDRVRALLEGWLTSYPAGERQRLVRDLKESDTKFSSAFWELYLHQLVLAHGGEAGCHPEVSGSARRPDYLVEILATGPFFLEACVLGEQSEFRPQRRRGDEIRHGINDRVSSDHYILHMEVASEGDQQIAASSVATHVARWLRSLDAPAVAGTEDRKMHVAVDATSWSNSKSGWRLSFSAHVRSRHNLDPRLVQSGPSYGGFVTDSEDLHRAIMRKYTRYGMDPSRPLVVAVMIDRITIDESDIKEALFGLDGDRDGVWWRNGVARGGRLSAVLIGRGAKPYFVPNSRLEVWHNPWADRPLVVGLRNAEEIVFRDGELVRSAASATTNQVFGLPNDWPGPEPAFDSRHEPVNRG